MLFFPINFERYWTLDKDPLAMEIQNEVVAKSYMTNGLLIYDEIFAHFLTY
jgi:hypothetical protein